MKIILINPPDDLTAFLGGGSVFISNLEPLGLLYVAAVCRQAGHDVKVIDAYAERLNSDQLVGKILDFDPDVIGFTSFTSCGSFLYEFGKRIKIQFPEKIVIFGNVHASVYAKEYLKNGCCDIVVHGEGEGAILKILDSITCKAKWHQISSISFIDNDNVLTTANDANVVDITKLPLPARDLLPQHLYDIGPITNFRLHNARNGKRSKHMFTSRGCPYRCLFCVAHGNKKQRFNTTTGVVDEIEILTKQYNTDYIFFSDSLFISNKDRVIDICNEIKRRKLDFIWGCEAHVNFIDQELVEAMESAGCVDMNFGLESGVQRLLNGICKGIKIETIETSVNLVRKHSKISLIGLFILGLPGETPKDSMETIKFANKLPLDMAQFSILTPYPGSYLFNQLSEKGEIDTGIRPDGTIDTSVWKRYSAYISYTDNKPIWVTPNQTAKGLKKLQKQALRSFYLRPDHLFKQIKRLKLSNLGILWKAFVSTFF